MMENSSEIQTVSSGENPTTNVLIVGVGGQGVLMVSKVLALLCQRRGYKVKQSEVHGMAKRGGIVFSHVRFGKEVWSPTIPQGEADVLLALEWAEGVRWLPYLKHHKGTFIADTQQIVPPFACLDRRPGATLRYATESAEEILNWVDHGYAVDATRQATELGNAKVSNTLLLGILSTVLDFPEDEWLDCLEQFAPAKAMDVNRLAFKAGREWASNPVMPVPESVPELPPSVNKNQSVALEIIPDWCKGCDICVKMCPERILYLNGKQIVEISDREACTGCRICEMLCPDFAIAVHIA